MNKTPHFINGAWIPGSGKSFASTNPATHEILWEGASAGEKEVNDAVTAAAAALPTWTALGLDARVKYLERFKELLSKNKDALTEILCQETGKAKWDASGEIAAMIGKLPVSVQAYHERTGAKEGEGAGFKTALVHKPFGVLAVYGPYNFPAHLPNGHILPALIAGNTVVFKPSEITPKIAEATMKLWEETGLPKGVINLVQGERETGQLLASHAGIAGLLFTGSSATGAILEKQFADKPGKILALELGGNNPLVVHTHADRKASIFNIIQSAFMTTGQRCSCTRRLILTPEAEPEILLKELVSVASNLTAGAYDQSPEPYMGPIVSGREVEKLLAAQDRLIALGAKPLLKMTRPDATGFFLTPAILDVTGVHNIPDEEYFGPILQVYRANNLDDAIRIANNTQFGLTAGLLADARDDFEHFRTNVNAGVVNWNRPTTGASAGAPFGGLGKSGNHRPSAYYAADYCAYPAASSYNERMELPETLPPGLKL